MIPAWVATLFARFQAIYGYRAAKMLNGDRDETLQLWARHLGRFHPDDVREAVADLAQSPGEPPTLGLFLERVAAVKRRRQVPVLLRGHDYPDARG